MAIQPVNNTYNRNNYKYNAVKWTGYGAAGLGTLCMIQASRQKIKTHKIFAWLTALSALSHIGLIEYLHNKK